ncbi:MAG: histidine phosphatase family protein [Alphaproteobacteria bacterium]|mgnify:CR=1 FL=1|nr:histidine phosphatase family protein [Alphaproteobacteria bacterium]
MKRLYLLRHAKAVAGHGGADHERALADRGRSDAPAMGKAVARRGYLPGLVLCSTARRTAETLDLVLPFLTPQPLCRLEPGLYHAEAAAILGRAAAIDDGVGAVMFIGHNPGLEDLALKLAGDGDLARRIGEKFPTCAFAAFESPAADWRSAAAGRWTPLAFLTPAGL